jgi:hypothetical protein
MKYEKPSRRDAVCLSILQDRDSYGRVLWMIGDSIFRGLGLGKYPDEFTPEEIAAESRWPFRSPAATINHFLQGRPFVACFAGTIGRPRPTADSLRWIDYLVTERMIREGDFVVFLDVGEHGSDPDDHEQHWLSLRRAIVERAPVTLIVCTGFDNFASRNQAALPTTKHLFMYDLAFGDRSHNDAICAAAQAPVNAIGKTLLFEPKVFLEPSDYHADAIHLNLKGQTKLSLELLLFVLRELWGKTLSEVETLDDGADPS